MATLRWRSGLPGRWFGMKKGEKRFDAVKTMREIRDRLSEQFKGMTFEEQKRYIKERTKVRPKTAPTAKTGKEAA
jgi:hypothetical protein